MARVLMGLLLGCLGLGCHKDEPAQITPPVASTKASVTASASAPPSVSSKPGPKKCEAEIYGKVIFPPNAPRKDLNVFVAQGDCADAKATVISEGSVAESGTFVLEIFAPWGSDVSVCARPSPKATDLHWFGKAKSSFHLESEMELTFKDVQIELKKVP